MRLFRNRLTIALALLGAMTALTVAACAQPAQTPIASAPAASQSNSQVMPTATNPIVVDTQAKEIRLAARVNGVAFTAPTWHAVVYEAGKVSGAGVFQAYASPGLLYDALKFFGGQPGNNMPEKDYNSTYVQGSDIDVSVTWSGAPKTYSLGEVVKDPDGARGKGVKAKFGGNYSRIESAGTGCIPCLYSCPIGITSNSAYNGDDFARQKTAGQAGFLGDKSVLPADGTPVVLIYKVK